MIKRALYILFIMSLACGINPAARAQEVSVQDQETKTITLDIKNMDISDVLRMIADQSGLNIIASKNVKGLVAVNTSFISVSLGLITCTPRCCALTRPFALETLKRCATDRK